MYINITDSDKGNNKRSSGELVHYLDKENRMFKDLYPEQWFNGLNISIPSYLVKHSLDHNIAKLCKDDAKFFLVNISPSQKEIRYLKEQYGEKGAETALKEYAVGVMDEYARNFHKPGINNNKDLMWFAKLEHYRYYNNKDPEVINGEVKKGSLKPGEQLHVQVIVSRKDMTNRIRLSPMNTSRGKNIDHSKKLGQFDRSAFKASGERLFDQQFRFERGLTDTFNYANTLKNGNLEQRLELQQQQSMLIQANTPNKSFKPSPELKVEPVYFKSPLTTNFLEIALAKTGYDPAPTIRNKKRRRKGKQQQQELNL
ncbi:molybdopterin-guanine dinucleotide biosynthesis protein MobB [Pedobacter sp. KBW06]|uniref:DUF5712 family protein n=1 Tax=Pedobacter sp. KBW06 TaxID=2153359 RepID=UPI000F5A97E1|nr:DUF5712 family protein [Pedobacter sp. KBW06]RQO64859.1 molybdopterin-guanine dinucleotide biosynthesis protein MobB [Pedobacter sp. KBW06]